MERICVILAFLSGAASAQEPFFNFGEGFSLAENEAAMVVGYRTHTTTSLMEFIGRAVLIDRLEVSPTEISIQVGEELDLGQILVVAFSSRDRIVERVPLAFHLEGPQDLLDFEAFRASGNMIKALRSGTATIWIEALPPSRSGEVIRVPINLIVE